MQISHSAALLSGMLLILSILIYPVVPSYPPDKNPSSAIKDTTQLSALLSEAYRDVQTKTDQVERQLPALKEAIDRFGYYSGVVKYASIVWAIYTKKLQFDKVETEIQKLVSGYADKLTDLESVQIRLFLANLYQRRSQFDKAVSLYTELLPSAMKSELVHAQLLNGRANVYEDLGEYEKAVADYLNAERIYARNGHRENSAIVLNNIALIQYSLKKYASAVGYYRKGITIAEQDSLVGVLLLLYPNIGVAYEEMDSLDAALLWHGKGNDLAVKTGDRRVQAVSLLNTGNVFRRMGKHDKAIDNFRRSMILCRELGIDYGIGLNNISLGKSYGATGKYAEAVASLRDAESFFGSVGLPEELMNTYDAFSGVYQSMGAWKQAFDYKEKFQAIKDSLFNEKQLKEIARLQTAYETEKKEAEIAIQAEQLKRNETEMLVLYVSGGFLVILLAGTFLYYRLRMKNLRALFRSSQELSKKSFVPPIGDFSDFPGDESDPSSLPSDDETTPQPNRLQDTGNETEIVQKPTQARDPLSGVFGRVVSLMEQERLYLNPDLTIAQVTEKAHSNEKYVSGAVKKGAGMNFNSFVNSYRIAEAKRLLSESAYSLSIEQISSKCGFNSRTTFFSAFQKSTGMTPVQYRKFALEQQNDE